MRTTAGWMVLVMKGGLFVALFAATSALAAAPPPPAQLEAVFQQIDAQRNLTLAEKYEAKLAVHKASLEAGQAYLDALENLQKYAAIAGEAGERFRPETAAVLTRFSERLEKAANNPVVKQFGNLVKAEGYAAEAVKLVSELDEIGRDPNLPPSARRSLQALRGAAEALSRAGDVPLAGPVLETYGNCVKELTTAVRQTARQVTALKGGGFSLTEQKELLAGLEEGNYRRTTLFEQGLPVVEEVIREQGSERVYLQVEPGRWTEVTKRLSYPQLVALVQDFRLLHDGRNPTPQEIVHYVASPDDRRDLAERALFEAQFRITRALRDDIAPDLNFRPFDDAQDKMRERLEALGLPVAAGSSAFRTLLQAELKQTGSGDALLRSMALNLTPYARDYLRYRGVENPDAVSLDVLAKLLDQYRQADIDKFAAWLAKQDVTKVAGTTDGRPAAGGKSVSTTPAEQPPPKDEQTEKLERRAKELAEKGLKPRDPAAPVDPNEAKPVVPEDCTLEIVTWRTEAAGERQSARYDVRSGAVTSRLPDQNYPESDNPQGYSFYGALTVSHSFAGRIEGNTIAGTWTAAYTPQQAWGWKDGEKRTQFYRYRTISETRSETEIVLNADGTLLWSIRGMWRSRHEMLEGAGPPPKNQENLFNAAGVGVWQLRKSEAVPSKSKESPQ